MLLATTPTGLRAEAWPGLTASCPLCGAEVIPKCGPIVRWHWAHRAGPDCDRWAEPESAWHVSWKAAGPSREVVIAKNGERHRADVVTASGVIVELQASFLSVVDIAARERFYGRRMVWLYRAEPWTERVHFGRKGFWWKHGARSMTASQRPLYWDVGNEVWRVSLTTLKTDRGHRVVGKVVAKRSVEVFRDWLSGKAHS